MDHAGNTRERLIKETRHVAIVDRKSGTCGKFINQYVNVNKSIF